MNICPLLTFKLCLYDTNHSIDEKQARGGYVLWKYQTFALLEAV